MYIKSLSELIEYLENIKEEHGDVAVYKIFRENIEDFSDIITVDNSDEDDVYVEIGQFLLIGVDYMYCKECGIIFYPEEAINEGMCEECYDNYLDDLDEDED